jgi:endo-1,4-beta-xylanase
MMQPLLTRRQMVFGGIAAAAGLAATQPTRSQSPGLRSVADQKSIYFGAAVDAPLLDDPAYASLLVQDCNIVVPRNALKWSATERGPGKFGFGEADKILRFAEANHMAMRGHTLVWHNLPKWVEAIKDAGELKAATIGHIEGVVGHYAGKVVSWDVVNEPLEYDKAVMRASPFMRLLGEDYIDLAFNAARSIDSKAQLVLNETHLCKAGDMFAARRSLVVDLVGRLQDRKVPIDAIGIQGHFNPGLDKLDPDGFGQFCRTMKERGLGVLITELDASCRFVTRLPGFAADDYGTPFHDLITAAASEGTLSSVTVWGLSEYRQPQNEAAGPNKACKVRINLYDADNKPLPTRAAVAEALQSL